ncbi:hypothetical protein HBN50_17225 [Halobacteriovorax sp. GB3]|uniref:hypothetical protein n=1 Tax=Halobacteriovorax sp. GB3 TaxID=2719615 RepID=UPI002361E1F3|nr:hypothetical protein [Halobacteriovorax sp. GB3]MDD0854849.1 hypothetical protein [Halobacteriovorax sp. GB3]
MKIWVKIEKLINDLLMSFFSLVDSFIKKLTPSKIKRTLSQSSEIFDKSKKDIKSNIEQAKVKAAKKVLTSKDTALKKIEKTKGKVQDVKSYNWKALTFQKVIIAILAFFSPLTNKIKLWYLSLKPATMAGIIITGAATGLTGVTIYTQTKEIIDKTQGREPASLPAELLEKSKRGRLHLIDERSLRLSNVKMPVYVESRKHLNTLLMEFTIVSSNRYIKEYFYEIENETLLRDKLSTKVHPFTSDFSLEKEGKDIIRKKIKEEANALIKELQIKGEVQEVYIHSLLAN